MDRERARGVGRVTGPLEAASPAAAAAEARWEEGTTVWLLSAAVHGGGEWRAGGPGGYKYPRRASKAPSLVQS